MHRGIVVWDDAMTEYDFGPSHPMSPIRLDLTMRLARSLGVLDSLTMVAPNVPDDALLLLGHTQKYIDAVRRCGVVPKSIDLEFGLGTPDVPTFTDMHGVSARIAAGTVEAARAVLSGQTDHAFNPAGGLHHAMRAAASGFCVYNDVSIAIQWLLDHDIERVAYVDTDVHHGDGVEAAFWNDPRVLTISLHESPQSLFPGTGWPTDIGGPDALGQAVNVALPAGTGDDQWLRALHSVVPQLLKEFAPQVLVTQHGCDSHFLDPLAHLSLSVDGQRLAYESLHGWSHEYSGGRWVATGGGGYAIVDVVPRTWTVLMAELSGRPLPASTPVPEDWRAYVEKLTGVVAPRTMTDGRRPVIGHWSQGYDPEDGVDRAILATRRAVFGHHGLDPERD